MKRVIKKEGKEEDVAHCVAESGAPPCPEREQKKKKTVLRRKWMQHCHNKLSVWFYFNAEKKYDPAA